MSESFCRGLSEVSYQIYGMIPAHERGPFTSHTVNPLKSIALATLPRSVVELIALYRNRTFLGDGLLTFHTADFLRDPKFMHAYELGKATGSWNGSDPVWRVNVACWAARHALSLPGDFVECGVNRGGMARAIVEYTDFGRFTDRRFFLLDTYKGHPDVAQPNRASYEECYTDVVKTFLPFPNVKIVRGLIPDTLSEVDSQKVCYLSIDMNHAPPEIAAARFFFPKLMSGAVVLLDDYAFSEAYRPQKTAFDDLASELGFSILSLPTGQGMIIKT